MPGLDTHTFSNLEEYLMKQLTQKLKDGKIRIIDVPAPIVSPGMLLVHNAFSVISSGTEGSKVNAARKNLLGKAKERPQQARQVVELVKQAGPVQTYRTVMKKLDSYSPLGYSSAGTVIGCGDGVSGFSIGDKVACAGVGAAHSEIISVPQNLCVKLSPDADLKRAAYNSLGAIALQGIRQADLRLGESCAVIGLGLLGQLTCLLLRAGGNKVIGIDINPEMVHLAAKHAADYSAQRHEIGLAEKIEELTGGIGVDAVIITAASGSTDPVNFAGSILRKKGKVIIVGSVPTGFEREPFYYAKELELRMSCSYGPGRYDPAYEEKGIDYPPAYARWTERRNMQAFQEFVHSEKVNIDYLTTHVFKLDEAEKAYDLITQKSEFHVGVVIEYGHIPSLTRRVSVKKTASLVRPGDVSVAFIGAGSYAMGHLLPHIPKGEWIKKKGVMTASGLSSRTVTEKFGFEYCASDENDILRDDSVNTVFVATRHDTHAKYVIEAMKAGKHVFVEKPLCITESEFMRISEFVDTEASIGNILMVGFNRRFSPLTKFIKEKINPGPMAMMYRINAGKIPPESWIQDKQIGGGRIIGEVCHFIDLLTFINGSLPEKVQAFSMRAPGGMEDSVTINIQFLNGSIGVISYFANGAKALAKEYLEIYKGGCTAILKDFREAEVITADKTVAKKLRFQDKGQADMVKEFFLTIKNGGLSPIPFDEIAAVTLATFRGLQSLSSGSVLPVASEASAPPDDPNVTGSLSAWMS
jgi:predicted dehydrogenase/threonine dehydrogenase-like Zn-dependent dehydrogenase